MQVSKQASGDEQELEVFRFFDPVCYLSTFLSHGIRPGGRSPSTARTVTLNVGSISTADGSATVRLGLTRVLAAVKMELSNPPLNSGSQGYLVCNVDLPSSSLPEAGSGPPGMEAQAFSQRLQDVISKFVDCEHLLLVEDKLCWTIYVDVVCLCNNGSVWDACTLAATAALLNTRVPVLQIDSGSPLVNLSETPTSLKLGKPPLTASFAVFNDNDYLLDPSREEEKICSGIISLSFYEDGKVAQIKHTGEQLSSAKLIQLCKDGQKHTQSMYKLLNTVCKPIIH